MRAPTIWKTLGIKSTSDRTEIRRAYAKQLKLTHPEDDPEGFKTLRAAYEQALQRAAWAEVHVAPQVAEALEDDEEGEVIDGQDPPGDLPPLAVRAAEPETERAETPGIAPKAPDEQALYSAACGRLEHLLTPRAQGDDAAKVEALSAVLTSSVLDSIAARDSAELWLAQLAMRTQPHSDALIEPLIKAFSWSTRTLDHRQPWVVRNVLHRAEDVRFLKAIQSPISDSYKAFHVLSVPPPTTLRGRLFQKASRQEVEELLGRIRRSHPYVESRLNAEAIKAWDERLRRPDASGLNLWMLIATPFCLLGILIFALSAGWNALPAFILLSIPPVWGFASVAVRYAFDASTRLWRESRRWQQSPWLALGWGPALIALLMLAAAAPSPILTGLTVFLSLVIVWWAAVTGEPERSESIWPWPLRLLVSEIFLVGWWLCVAWDMPSGAAWQMTPVVLSAPLVSGLGRRPLLQAWLRLRMPTQRYMLIAIIAATIGAAGVLWNVYEHDWLRPLAFACGAIVMLLARVPALSTPAWSGGFVRVICYLTLVMTRAQGGPMMTLAVVGTVLLGLTALNAGVAFVRVKGR